MIITSDSHVDHNLTQAQLDFIMEKFKDRNEFFIQQITLPDNLGKVLCGLYGPMMGDHPISEDKVFYVKRGNRTGNSRMINEPMRPTDFVTVIGGPNKEGICILYTAFGGPCAPREPFDSSLTDKDIMVSNLFWSNHALSAWCA